LTKLSVGTHFKEKTVSKGGGDKEIGKPGADPCQRSAKRGNDKHEQDADREKCRPLFSRKYDEGLLADESVALNGEEVAQGGSDQRKEKNDPAGVHHTARFIAAGKIGQDRADCCPGHRYEKGFRGGNIFEFYRKFLPPGRH